MKIALRLFLLCTVCVFLTLPALAEDEPKKDAPAEAGAKDVTKGAKDVTKGAKDVTKGDKDVTKGDKDVAKDEAGDKKEAKKKKRREQAAKADKGDKVSKATKKARKVESMKLPGFELPASIELTVEQRTKIELLKKDYAPKSDALEAKARDGISAEKRQAMREAHKTARAEGKKGKELQEAVQSKANLTDEEKAKLQAVRKEQRVLRQEIQAAVRGVLTEEQIAKLPQAKRTAKKEKKNKAKA